MNNSVISRKSPLLILIVLIFSFCAANSSFSQEFERKKITEDMKCYKSTQSVTTLSEGKTGKSILIRLGRTHFDPLQKLPAQKAGINSIQAFGEGETGYYIIQFDGPIMNSWKMALENTGAEIFDYVPDFAFIIRSASTKEQSVRALPHVRWLGIYQPSYRISQGALDKTFVQGQALEEDEGAWELLRITIFPGEDLDRIKSEIDALGGMIIDEVTTKWKTTLKVKAPSTSIANLPAISGVKWIEPVPVWKLFNNVSSDIMNVRTPRDTYGLYGEGQTVGVCDSGLDQGSHLPASLHDDFEDGSGGTRVTQLIDLSGDGAWDYYSGHGTHVACSVLGNGLHSGSNPSSNSFPPSCFAGIAPKANLVFQATANDAGSLVGIPSDLNILFSEADVAGADLHTNSWGSSVSGMYTSYSQDVDEYMWDYKDFLVLFSAGNDGIDMDGDGVIDLYSMGSPSTAKNCLTVGASEGDRPSGAGYDTQWATGSWAVKYSVDPIFSDHVSDDPDGMAAFSSRGPVLDGRYKPDIVAPGTNILSARSSVASGTLWGVYDSSYLWSGGTSMSTPLVAGAAALMREYLMDVKGHANPSAALTKAALLNSAEDITPGQYGTGAAQEIPDAPVPNNVEGWGRLNLGNGVYPASPFTILYYDEQNSLNTGEHKEYSINVSDPGAPLKINLVWTDYPGSPATQGGLVNDLDLQITDPSSTVMYPDHASQKSQISTIAYDDDDPEVIYNANKLAVKFAPSSYPANVESTSFYFYNPSYSTSDVDVVVYDDTGSGGLPGTQLIRKTLTYVPTGWITVGITGVVINSGEFYIAIEKNDANQSLLQDDSDPTGRSYWHNGSEWVQSLYTSYIRANVRGTDYSTSFDRVNNVLGLTIDSPATGTYTIRVSGYNVPYGPQPYALVISGNVSTAGFADELALDFGVSGLWDYDGTNWAFISGSNPEGMAGWSGGLALDFGASGVWNYDGTTWTPISGSDVEDMADWANGLAMDFGASGVWSYDGTTWAFISGSSPEGMAGWSSGLAMDFGASGLWSYDGTTWTPISGSSPEGMVGWSGGLALDFGASGVWSYDGTTWTFISGSDVEDMADWANGLAMDFGASGVWSYDGTTWAFISGSSPEGMAGWSSGLAMDFGASGLWSYDGGTTWTFISGSNVEDMDDVDLY